MNRFEWLVKNTGIAMMIGTGSQDWEVVVRFWIWWLGKMECGDELKNMNMNG
jgi:hypothetical protein